MYESFSIIFAIAALLSFINYKWLKLPNTIGQLILALGIAVIVISLEHLLPSVYQFFCDIVQNADFTHILLDILLGFLLCNPSVGIRYRDVECIRTSYIL